MEPEFVLRMTSTLFVAGLLFTLTASPSFSSGILSACSNQGFAQSIQYLFAVGDNR
jgi:hypothetical protein